MKTVFTCGVFLMVLSAFAQEKKDTIIYEYKGIWYPVSPKRSFAPTPDSLKIKPVHPIKPPKPKIRTAPYKSNFYIDTYSPKLWALKNPTR